jgi:hypothetical protein
MALAERRTDLIRFYDLLTALAQREGGPRRLVDCHGRMLWPPRGVYFVFEPGESRSNSGEGLRVVRVGTHALKQDSATTLWNRLAQHRGLARSGSGSHRGSIFRLLVGAAIKRRDRRSDSRTWGVGSDPGQAAQQFGITREEVRREEHALEVAVSHHIGAMSWLWLAVNDPPGPESDRGVIERNSIGLLSNYERKTLDPPSEHWLGAHCDRERVRQSGLWNNNHVDEGYDPRFLDLLKRYVEQTR